MKTFLFWLFLSIAAIPVATEDWNNGSCGSNDDELIYAAVLPRDVEKAKKVIAKWDRWTDKHEGIYCLTLVSSPVVGRDGKPVVIPMLLVFRLPDDYQPPDDGSTWIERQGRPVA